MSSERSVRLHEEMEQLRKANHGLTKKQLELVEKIGDLGDAIRENCNRTRQLAKELMQEADNEAQSSSAGPSITSNQDPKDGVSESNDRRLTQFLGTIAAKQVQTLHGEAQSDVDPPAVNTPLGNMRVSVDENDGQRWKDIRRFTDRPSKFAHPAFTPGISNLEVIQECRVLVVGAGGLGCEILKNLALSGFKKIDVIDMDTIDLTNLNRQFLFRESDIGKSKAEVAAAFIEKRVSGCRVTAHNCKIQEKKLDFYREFGIVICGLDSITARRWLNATLCDLVQFDESGEIDVNTIIPLIDGGTEGFKGNARVILPHYSPCVECTLDLYPPQVNFPMCTIAHTPRLPEHCVEYVKVIQWEKENPFDEPLDGDKVEHVEWVCAKAQLRAEQYGINGVDLRLAQGVIKRIIPAVASTNAVIAGACALEALKIQSNIGCPMDNYMNFTDIDGCYFGVVKLERNPECIACSRGAKTFDVKQATLLREFIEELTEKYQLKNPYVKTSEEPLYMINSLIPELEEVSKENLKKALKDLGVAGGDELVITDESISFPITLRVKYID